MTNSTRNSPRLQSLLVYIISVTHTIASSNKESMPKETSKETQRFSFAQSHHRIQRFFDDRGAHRLVLCKRVQKVPKLKPFHTCHRVATQRATFSGWRVSNLCGKNFGTNDCILSGEMPIQLINKIVQKLQAKMLFPMPKRQCSSGGHKMLFVNVKNDGNSVPLDCFHTGITPNCFQNFLHFSTARFKRRQT